MCSLKNADRPIQYYYHSMLVENHFDFTESMDHFDFNIQELLLNAILSWIIDNKYYKIINNYIIIYKL